MPSTFQDGMSHKPHICKQQKNNQSLTHKLKHSDTVWEGLQMRHLRHKVQSLFPGKHSLQSSCMCPTNTISGCLRLFSHETLLQCCLLPAYWISQYDWLLLHRPQDSWLECVVIHYPNATWHDIISLSQCKKETLDQRSLNYAAVPIYNTHICMGIHVFYTMCTHILILCRHLHPPQ